eukprot:scaffold2830_cov131-Cylindrotheca_fusiformis.AAC.72
MEQLWDKSLEQQAVARAWRMGAKGSVQVETLVAKNTVEETMCGLEKQSGGIHDAVTLKRNGDNFADVIGRAGKSSEYQRAKLQYLLRGLSLITNPTMTSFADRKRKATFTATAPESLPLAVAKKPRATRRVHFEA